MRLIKSNYEIIKQEPGLEGIYKAIELAGRISHKSEAGIKEGSAKTFVDNMIKLGHNATLEFGTVYLLIKEDIVGTDIYFNYLDKYKYNKYSMIFDNPENSEGTDPMYLYITTNYRVLVENGWLDDLKYLCEPTEYHAKRICVRWNIDRVTGESFLRHRVFSFMRESTRYCNYANGRFNHEITCTIPSWLNEQELSKYGEYHTQDRTSTPESIFMAALNNAEESYFALLNKGWRPEQARQVLPFSIYSPLMMCGFIDDWKHFFELRDNKHAHPDAHKLAHALHEEFLNNYYLTE